VRFLTFFANGEYKLEITYMSTASKLGPHTRTNRGTCHGEALNLLQRPLHCRVDSAEFMPSLCVVGLGPVVARACLLVHEVARAEEVAERRCASRFNHAGLEVEEHRAGSVLAALGLVVK
jgi:hypothetical protein